MLNLSVGGINHGIKKGIKMEKHIKIASSLGSLLSKSAFYVERNPVDPDYSRKVKDDELRLSRPIYLYSIKQIEITSTKLDVNANGNKVVTFNEDPDMQMSLLHADSIEELIPKPTQETVKKAIMQAANGGKKILFTDSAELYKCVRSLNNDSKTEWDNQLNMMINYSKTFTEANEIERMAAEKYLKNIGIDPKGVL